MYDFWIEDHHQQRMQFLRPLSMTCKAMRSRFLPWVWERLELPPPWSPGTMVLSKKLTALANALHADISLATNVMYFCAPSLPRSRLIHALRRFMTVHLGLGWSTSFPFVKCLKSLPNLHTLEIGWVEYSVTTLLKDALKGVKLPQIKTLILPPPAHPLLQHCCNVEDVVCVVGCETKSSDGFLRSLTSKRDSKVKRLAIPLVLWPNAPCEWFGTCGIASGDGD